MPSVFALLGSTIEDVEVEMMNKMMKIKMI